MSESPNRILEFLTAPPQPAGEASRSNRRRRSSAKVELSWSTGSGWRTARGRLRDIGRGGACLVVDRPPDSTGKARFRFTEGEGSPWVEGIILEVAEEKRGRSRVRLQFESPCPSFMLQFAVLGASEAEDEAPSPRYQWVTTGHQAPD